MVEVKRFAGKMDTDSRESFILPEYHKYAKNGRFYGSQSGMTFQNVMGNTQIPNAQLPVTGVNTTVGAFFDQNKLRIFYFNYNSLGFSGIYLYDVEAATTTPLLICGTNSPIDILNFNLQQLIVSVNIIYGDAQQGDILYFIDCLGRSTQINIDQALAGSYGTFQRSYLNVIKETAAIPPVCRYEDDNTVTVNNTNGQLFQFKIRWIFNNNDMSVTSAWGIMPLPQGSGDPTLSSNPATNAVIKLIIPTGANNVKKIEILGTTSLGTIWSDFFSIDILIKADLSIPDNDIYIYKFYNNAIYAPIDINESNQLFDYVPQLANTQEVLLTNIIIYGGITENFNPVTPNVAVTENIFACTDIRFGLLCVQNADTIGTSGTIHISLVGKAAIPQSGNNAAVTVNIETSAGNITYSTTYTSSLPTTTSIITALAASATGLGFTVISSGENDLYISKTGATLEYFNIVNEYGADTIIADSIPVWDWSNQETFGLVYFDQAGRSDGVFYTLSMTGQTVTYSPTGQPYVQINISNPPPNWAYYYQLVRIANPTKSRLEYWITDQAYPGTDLINNETYAYLSITNLNQYITNNPSTATQLSYSWTANDRVKIWQNMQAGTIYSANNDYQIINSLNNPTINGVMYTGQYLQILLPPSGSGIIIDGTKPNFNFLIEFYTPTKSLAETNSVYFECGRRYSIGNPTTATAYHQGETQNQNPDGSGSAQIMLYDGDNYMRLRTINAGNQLSYTITGGGTMNSNTALTYVLPETFTETFTTIEYTPLATTLAPYNTSGFPTTNNWITVFQTGVTFTIKGNLVFQTLTPSTHSWTIEIRESFPNQPTTVVTTIATIPASAGGVTINVPINYTFTPASFALPDYVYITADLNGSNSNFQVKISSGNLIFVETGSVFTVNIIDQNFSDFYPSAVNSNGRAWAIQPNIEQIHVGTLVRYGLPYDPETIINNVNRFYAQNFDQYDDGAGEIRRMKYRGRFMRIFQDRKVGEVPIFQNVLTNTNGQTQIGQSENVINNIQYYEGEFGMGGLNSSLISGKIQDYFADPVRGYWIRVSNDGVIPISELYFGQYYIRSLITPYAKTYTRADGGTAQIMGFYDYFDEQMVTIMQGGTNGSNTISNYAYSFNEKRNGFCSFYDYSNAEFALSAQDVIYSFKNGLLYIHNNTTNYCQFYGVNYNLQIQLVFNKDLYFKKTLEAIGQLTTAPFGCPSIYTNIPYGNSGAVQNSSIPVGNFTLEEGYFNANLLRDLNGQNGSLITGATLKGSWLAVMFEILNAQSLVDLDLVELRMPDSELNVKQ